jgi:AcrR family transcriptional regulator
VSSSRPLTGTAPPPESPRTPGRRIRGLDAEQRRQQRRQQLLDAALELIAANGYSNTSIEQICQAAYVGTKGFYEIFDSKEACYVDLLRRIAETSGTTMVEAMRTAPSDEHLATPILVATFAHSLVDDSRVAVVTFGEASGVSRAIEVQRRANRRWAAQLVESIWSQYDESAGARRTQPSRPTNRHRMAIGAVGGMFDLIADWLLDANPTDDADIQRLIDDLTAFFQIVRAGLDAL